MNRFLTVAAALLVPIALGAAAVPALAQPAEDDITGLSLAKTPLITAFLNKGTYAPGEVMDLFITDNIWAKHTFQVVDSNGIAWTQVSESNRGAVFSAAAPTISGTLTVTLTRTFDNATASATASYGSGGQPPPPPSNGQAQWPGHQPGKFYLGMSCGTQCTDKNVQLGQSYGVSRLFNPWGNWSGLASDIQGEQRAGRLPWVSIKPPAGGADGWQAISSGRYDADIRALAATLKANDDKPVLLTFHHEPSNDGTEAEGQQWADAYVRIHDILDAEGALANVADPPIVGDWLFNPTNRTQDPANWLTEAVLQRAPFMGIDLYENGSGETFAERVPRILIWLASHGHPDMMVGIGETGGTDARYAGNSSVDWINDSLSWVAANADKVGVISYFNSTANSRSGVYWPLDESAAKMSAFRYWLDQTITV